MEALDRLSAAWPGTCWDRAPGRLQVVPTNRAEGADTAAMAMETELQLLGVSFHTAPLEVREALALDAEGARAALRSARAVLPEGEVLVLSTCNRTELYAVGASDEALAAWHHGVLQGIGADAACTAALTPARYHLRGRAAARHLFRVAAGLESALLGDNEIVGQLRAAARLSDELGLLGPRLRLVVDHALRTSKQARAETSIGAGGAGIGAAVAGVVASRTAPAGRVMLVGAGDAAAVIARELRKRLAVDLTVVNRSPGRAAALATQHGGVAAPLDDLPDLLPHADVVVAATSSPEPVITPGLVSAVLAQHAGWGPLVVDAGHPRNVDPACSIEVVTMESLAARTRRVSGVRAAAVADVERYIDEGLARWHLVEVRRLIRQGIGQLDVPSISAAS
jgi:glutamyl-tRNA reductase